MATVIWVLGHEEVDEAALAFAGDFVDVEGVGVDDGDFLVAGGEDLLSDSFDGVVELVLGAGLEEVRVE
jgi:hypothetical protein